MCRMVPCRQINTFPQKNSGHTYWNPIHTGLPVQYKLRSVSPPSDTTAAWQCFVWLWLVGTVPGTVPGTCVSFQLTFLKLRT